MTLSLLHAFQSAKADGSDSTRVQPSNWNAEHSLECATGVILGRVTAGAGAVEELSADDVWAALGIVAGTKMLFQQTTPPTGWTKDTDHNNKALRLVSGSVSSGGSSPFSTVFGKTATDGHALSTSQMPSHSHGSGSLSGVTDSDNHNHGYARHDSLQAMRSDSSGTVHSLQKGSSTSNTDSDSHNHSVSISGSTSNAGSGSSHSHNIDLRVQYVDVIIATKD